MKRDRIARVQWPLAMLLMFLGACSNHGARSEAQGAESYSVSTRDAPLVESEQVLQQHTAHAARVNDVERVHIDVMRSGVNDEGALGLAFIWYEAAIMGRFNVLAEDGMHHLLGRNWELKVTFSVVRYGDGVALDGAPGVEIIPVCPDDGASNLPDYAELEKIKEKGTELLASSLSHPSRDDVKTGLHVVTIPHSVCRHRCPQ